MSFIPEKQPSAIVVNALYGDPAAGKQLLALQRALTEQWELSGDEHFESWFVLRFGDDARAVHPDLAREYVAALYRPEFEAHLARLGRQCRYQLTPHTGGIRLRLFVCVGDH